VIETDDNETLKRMLKTPPKPHHSETPRWLKRAAKSSSERKSRPSK
jgi:hypothetical protein